jgi:hypothetical protein
MAKIKIKDLPKDKKISVDAMMSIRGGSNYLELATQSNMTSQQMQLLSNISKNQHDTLLGIIQNLKS